MSARTATSAEAPATAGYFGKLPSHGDFLREGLPGWFVSAWDGWLQAGMTHAALNVGPAWADTFEAAPAWQFCLPVGALHAELGVVGVLAPSCDKVGRLFPCTVATLHAGDARATMESARDWLDSATATLAQATSGDGSALARIAALAPPDVLLAQPGASGDAATLSCWRAPTLGIETQLLAMPLAACLMWLWSCHAVSPVGPGSETAC